MYSLLSKASLMITNISLMLAVSAMGRVYRTVMVEPWHGRTLDQHRSHYFWILLKDGTVL